MRGSARWRLLLASAALVTTTAIAACGGGGGGDTPTGNQPSLTVQSALGGGSGTVSGSGMQCDIVNTLQSGTCAKNFSADADVVLAASPAAGSVFAGWGGPCSGTTTCLFKLSASTTVTANFVLFTWPLSVASGGGTGNGSVAGNGINCTVTAATTSGTCSSNLVPNTAVTLTATAASGGHVFAGWGDTCSGSAPTCTTTMTLGRNVTASFRAPTTLTVASGAGDGNGTVAGAGINCTVTTTTQSGTCSSALADTSTAVLTATPAAGGHTFAGWGGACASAGTATSCSIAMNLARNVTARFNAPIVRVGLTVTSGNGSGNGGVTATTNGGNISCSIVASTTSGTCTANPEINTSVTLTATPSVGFTFTGWGGGVCSGLAPTCVISMSQARTVSASFSTAFNLTVTSAPGTGNGSVAATTNDGVLACTVTGASTSGTCALLISSGTQVTLTATPSAGGHTFVGWGGACTGTSTCVVTMSQARAVTANFGAPASAFQLSVASSGGTGNGTVTGGAINCSLTAAATAGTCSASVASGNTVVLTATPAANHTFDGWGGACTGTGACSVLMNQVRNVTATFTAPVLFALNVTSGGGTGNGSVTASGINCAIINVAQTGTCTSNYNSGTLVTLTATPSVGGHVFSLWGGVCSGSASTCVVTMSQARSVTARFTAPANITVINGGGNGVGTVSSTAISCTVRLATSTPFSPTTSGSCTQTAAVGSTVTLTAAASTGGYTFIGWGGGACSGTGSCTLTVGGDVTVTAKFNAPALSDVQTQVFNVYCVSCHTSTLLNNTTNSFNNLVNVNSNPNLNGTWALATSFTKRVLPFQAANSYTVYQMQKSAGAYPMPTNATVVPTNLVDLVKNWINGGAVAVQP